MSKSILVIDAPDKCLDCPLGNSEDSNGEEVYCNILECVTYQSGIYESEEDEELYNSKKPDWCPIRDLPEKKSENKYHNDKEKGYASGFNACIDEILKGANGNE